jgi:predicted RNase H-like HicB family nuclease
MNQGAKYMSYRINVIIEQDEDGYYAYAPELEGCQSQGDSLDEVYANIREAVELFLETLPPDDIKATLSKTILTTALEVEVA